MASRSPCRDQPRRCVNRDSGIDTADSLTSDYPFYSDVAALYNNVGGFGQYDINDDGTSRAWACCWSPTATPTTVSIAPRSGARTRPRQIRWRAIRGSTTTATRWVCRITPCQYPRVPALVSIAAADTANASGATGVSIFDDTDWENFESPYRGWARDSGGLGIDAPGFAAAGRCLTGQSCAIWDWLPRGHRYGAQGRKDVAHPGRDHRRRDRPSVSRYRF